MSLHSDSEDESVDLGPTLNVESAISTPIWLGGRLCTNKPFNVYALIDVMLKDFRVKGKVIALEWGLDDRDWVINNQPWHFDGNLFAIAPLTGSEQPVTVKISRASFWERFYDLPLNCRNETAMIPLVRKVGFLEAFDLPENNLGAFLRFKVDIDIEKPLKKGLKIRLGGEKMWVPIKYESLSNYCFYCGTIGHQLRGCDRYDRNQCLAPSEMEYGYTIKAAMLKKSKGLKTPIKFYEKLSLHAPPISESLGSEVVHASSSNPLHGTDEGVSNTTPITISSPTLKKPTSISEQQSIQSFRVKNPTSVSEQPSIQSIRDTTSINDISVSLSKTANVGDGGSKPTVTPHTVQEGPNPKRTTWKRDARKRGASLLTAGK
ncbi:hypothetical protein ACS0TY_013928 [Phlomoides rotata]